MTYLSDATMKTLGLIVKYLPLPHPTSNPTEPSDKFLKKRSTIGHGCFQVQLRNDYLVIQTNLVTCGGKMRSNLLIHLVDVLILINRPMLKRDLHTMRSFHTRSTSFGGANRILTGITKQSCDSSTRSRSPFVAVAFFMEHN